MPTKDAIRQPHRQEEELPAPSPTSNFEIPPMHTHDAFRHFRRVTVRILLLIAVVVAMAWVLSRLLGLGGHDLLLGLGGKDIAATLWNA